MSSIHVLVFEGYADWEPGHALAGLRRWGHCRVVSVGHSTEPVVSMGGLRVVPDTTLEAVQPHHIQLLLLPGGDAWETGAYPAARLGSLLEACDRQGLPVAAICAATIAVARAGLLRQRRHTSNGPDYLPKWAPGQTRRTDYVPDLAIRDRGVITASGIGPVDFAYQIFAELGIFSPSDLDTWYRMHKNGQFDAAPA
jgi:putative intracellular protease/amidase